MAKVIGIMIVVFIIIKIIKWLSQFIFIFDENYQKTSHIEDASLSLLAGIAYGLLAG